MLQLVYFGSSTECQNYSQNVRTVSYILTLICNPVNLALSLLGIDIIDALLE